MIAFHGYEGMSQESVGRSYARLPLHLETYGRQTEEIEFILRPHQSLPPTPILLHTVRELAGRRRGAGEACV